MKKKYLVKKNNCYLVEGILDGKPFDGKGKAYTFNEKDAFFLRDAFKYTIEEDYPELENSNQKTSLVGFTTEADIAEPKIVTDSDLALLIQTYYKPTLMMSFHHAEQIAVMILDKFEGFTIEKDTMMDEINEAFEGINK